MVQHIGQLSRPMVGVERYAAYAQRVHCQFVKQVLGPVFDQQRYAVASAISGSGIQLHERLYGLCRFPVSDFSSRRIVSARAIGGYGKKRMVCILFGSAKECFAYG